MNSKPIRKSDYGIAMVIVLVVILIATIAAIGFSVRGSKLSNLLGIRLKKTQADYVAEEALERAFGKIARALEDGPPVVSPIVDEALFAADAVSANPKYKGSQEEFIPVLGAYWYYSGPSASDPNDHKNQYEVRYQIKSPLCATDNEIWCTNSVRDLNEKKYVITASVKGPRGERSVLRQNLYTRREGFYKYFMFKDTDIQLMDSDNVQVRGAIRSNGNIFIAFGKNDNSCSAGTGNTYSLVGSLAAAGHIIRAPINLPACLDYPMSFSPSNKYPLVKITDPLTNKVGYLFGHGSKWTDLSDTENFPSPLPSGVTTSNSGSDAIVAGPGFVPSDIRDPSKQWVDSHTSPGIGKTWAIDPRWESETSSVFGTSVADSSQGIKRIDPPDIKYFQPGGYYDSQRGTMHIITSDPNPAGDIIEVTVKDGNNAEITKISFNKSAVGHLINADDLVSSGKVRTAQRAWTPSDDDGQVSGSFPAGNYNGAPPWYPSPAPSVNTFRGKLPQVTNDVTVPNSALQSNSATWVSTAPGETCHQAISHGRVWSSKEDRFIYLTRINVQLFAENCMKPYPNSGLVYAARTDAVADASIVSDPLNVSSTRNPSGYALANGSNIPLDDPVTTPLHDRKPFMFITNSLLQVEGDFNRHEKLNGDSLMVDSDHPVGTPPLAPAPYPTPHPDTLLDVDKPTYNFDQDKWRPALLVADHVVMASNNFDYSWNNNARWADGRSAEFDQMIDTTQPKPYICYDNSNNPFACYCQTANCNIAPTDVRANRTLEQNAAIFGAFLDDVTGDPNRPGTSSVTNAEDFSRASTKMFHRTSMLTLMPATYATARSRWCGNTATNALSTSGSCAWTNGVNPSAWRSTRDAPAGSNTGHEPNFEHFNRLSATFRKYFPGGKAKDKPFQTDDWSRIDPKDDPLFPPTP